MKPTSLDDLPTFEIQACPDAEGNPGPYFRLTFDEVDFLIQTRKLTFPTIWGDEPPEESQIHNPAWLRLMATKVNTEFIPALTKDFCDEYGAKFSKGTINKLFSSYNKYIESLKKNTVDETSSQPSTESTHSSCPNTSTTTS